MNLVFEKFLLTGAIKFCEIKVPTVMFIRVHHCVQIHYCLTIVSLLNDLHCVTIVSLLSDVHCVTIVSLLSDLHCVTIVSLLNDLHCVTIVINFTFLNYINSSDDFHPPNFRKI